MLAIVVDDIALSSNSPRLMKEFKTRLSATFSVKLFGQLKSFVGWTINITGSHIKVDQRSYARQLLQEHGMDQANAVYTPLPQNADITPKREDESILPRDQHSLYRSIIGGLLYLSVGTRPDISFSVSVLARHCHAPTRRHMLYLKRVLRYVAGTVTLGLSYPRSGQTLSPRSIAVHVDADWGGCKETRRSTTGYIITINGTPIAWRTRRQTIIALSSAESEYIALSDSGKHITWSRKLYWEVANKEPWREEISFDASRIFIDSTAAMSLATNKQISARGKHIDLRTHHVRELLMTTVIELLYVQSQNNIADLLTKILGLPLMKHLIQLMNMSKE